MRETAGVEEIYHLWLAALPSPVPEDEARLYWNCKDDPTPALDEALRRASYLYVGSWGDEHEPETLRAGEGHCPAKRLHTWLFYRGTIAAYQAPHLDEDLLTQLLALHTSRPTDLPAPTIDRPHLETFLRDHEGHYLLPERPDHRLQP